jgi:DNA-damage-inducible protein J
MKTATVHARIDRETKEQSESVLRSIGMTPTDAVRLLYRQIAMRHEFPLELKVPNQLTAETLDKSDKNEEIESFQSAKELFKSWD